MTPTTPEAAQALEALRQLGFTLEANTGAYRLRRMGQQVQLYRLDGKLDVTGHLGNLSDATLDSAAINALKVAQAILADEARRLALGNRKIGKSLESDPY